MLAGLEQTFKDIEQRVDVLEKRFPSVKKSSSSRSVAAPPSKAPVAKYLTPQHLLSRWCSLLSGTLTTLAGTCFSNLDIMQGTTHVGVLYDATQYTFLMMVAFSALGAVFYKHQKSLDAAAKDEEKDGLTGLTFSEDLSLAVDEGITNLTGAMASILAQVWYMFFAQSGILSIVEGLIFFSIVLVAGEWMQRHLTPKSMEEYIVNMLNGLNVGSASWWLGFAMSNYMQNLFGVESGDNAQVTYSMWIFALLIATACMEALNWISTHYIGKDASSKPYGNVILSMAKGTPMYAAAFILNNVVQYRYEGMYVIGTLWWITIAVIVVALLDQIIKSPRCQDLRAKIYDEEDAKAMNNYCIQIVSMFQQGFAFVTGNMAGYALAYYLPTASDMKWILIGAICQVLAFFMESARTRVIPFIKKEIGSDTEPASSGTSDSQKASSASAAPSAPAPKKAAPSQDQCTPSKFLSRWFTLLSGTLTTLAGTCVSNMNELQGEALPGMVPTETFGGAVQYTVLMLIAFGVLGAMFYERKGALDAAAKDEEKDGLTGLTFSEDLCLTLNEGITNLTGAMASILAQVWLAFAGQQTGMIFVIKTFFFGTLVLLAGEWVERETPQKSIEEYIVHMLNSLNVGSFQWWVGFSFSNWTQELLGAPDGSNKQVAYWMWLVGLIAACVILEAFNFFTKRFLPKDEEKSMPYCHMIVDAYKGFPMFVAAFILNNITQYRYRNLYVCGTLFWITIATIVISGIDQIIKSPQGRKIRAKFYGIEDDKDLYAFCNQVSSLLGQGFAFVTGNLAGYALSEFFPSASDSTWIIIGAIAQVLGFLTESSRTTWIPKLVKETETVASDSYKRLAADA